MRDSDLKNLVQNQDPNALKELEKQITAGNENTSLVNKIGKMLLIKSFFPSGNHLKNALSYLDIAIKLEIFIYDLTSALFWISLLEIGTFVFSIFLAFTDFGGLAAIWLHLPHVVRGIIGFRLIKRIPYSHQLAQNISIPAEE